jgi:hypothetical protein
MHTQSNSQNATAPAQRVAVGRHEPLVRQRRTALATGIRSCACLTVIVCALSQVAEYWFGWVRLTAENATHLRGEFVEAAEEAAGQAGTGTRVGGAVLDEFVVVRGERRRGGEAVRVEEEEVVVLGGEEKEVDDASEVEFRSDGASATRIATSR